jgi:hypothetical protein
VGSNRFRLASASPLALALLACLALALPTAATAAPCPNEAFRLEQGVTSLPDCMAIEQVSPPAKAQNPAFLPSFSLDGERVLFKSMGALADTPGMQSLGGDQYVATRTAAGWATASTSPPTEAEIVLGGGAAFGGGPYVFSADLSRWVLSGATRSQGAIGEAQFFQGARDGSLQPLSPLLVPIDDAPGPDPFSYLQFATNSLVGTATSADLSTTAFRVSLSAISLFPDDPRNDKSPAEEAGGDRNSYVAFLDEAGEPQLQLLARDASGTVYGGRCGAHTGGEVSGNGAPFPKIYQGAISPDGSRIFFTTRPDQPWDEKAEGPPCDTANGLRILERLATPTGPKIEEIAPGGPTSGDDIYQGASEDGTKLYFTSPRKLAASDVDPSAEACGKEPGASKGCDLYLWDASLPPSERLIQVSTGEPGSPTPGEGADVLSTITAISKDGTHAYFVAPGVLTTAPNPEGDTPLAGQPNLYLYERDAAHPAGRLAFIGTLAASDKDQLWGAEGSYLGGAYAAPGVLAFASNAPLTADDADGAHRDVFRYDAEEETLERISKAAPGGADDGPFDVTVNPSVRAGFTAGSNFNENSRWISDDGQTIAFTTTEALDPTDEDGLRNPYLWRAGEVAGVEALLDPKEPPAVSPDGREVAFTSTDPMVPQDVDTTRDVYVLRPGGGFAPPPLPTSCNPLKEGSCQGAVGPPPSTPATATAAFTAAHGKPPCRKGQVRRRGKCVKPHKHHRKAGKAKRRGGRR